MIDADIKAWLPLVGLVLSEQETEAILSAAEQELSEYVRPDGTVGVCVAGVHRESDQTVG